MAKKKMLHFSNTAQFVNLYPSDFDHAIQMRADMFIQTSWSKNIRGSVSLISRYEGLSPTEPIGYRIVMGRGEDCISQDIGLLDAVTVFTGKKFNIRKIGVPVNLRDKVPFALSMNYSKKVSSMDELNRLYQEQMILHDEAILRRVTSRDKGYIPVRFDIGRFHVVVFSDGYGQYSLENGFYFFDGFPTVEETLNILNEIPEALVDIRRLVWVKSIIKINQK